MGDFIIEDGVLTKYAGSAAAVEIPTGVTEIGNRAFFGSKTLAEVSMPDSVSVIGSSAFGDCKKLKSIAFSAGLEQIGDGAFSGCTALKSVELPQTLRELGGDVFSGCTKLKSVQCSSKVFEPGRNPFGRVDEAPCKSLADPNGFVIFCGGLYAYYGSETELVIPDGVQMIAYAVFDAQNDRRQTRLDLKKVVIPPSVKRIDVVAFANNENLRELALPPGVDVAENAFSGCRGLADENGLFIYDGVAMNYFGAGGEVTVPPGVKVIARRLFYDTNVTAVSLPEGLERIREEAFRACKLLPAVSAPDTVRVIGRRAFYDCAHLASLTLSAQTELGAGALSGCPELADENGFVIRNNVLCGYFGEEADVVLPEGIARIDDGAFSGRTIRSVRFPSTLKTLGRSVFQSCKMLEEVDLPAGVTAIGDGAFLNCVRLRRAALPPTVQTIDESAFAGCEALKEISIPVGVTQIGSYAFRGCTALETIALPAGLTALGSRAFTECTALRSAELPAGLTKIDRGMFSSCAALETVTLPETLREIEYAAFEGCAALKTVRCAVPLERVVNGAFDGCDSLAGENGLMIIGGMLIGRASGLEHAVIPEGVTVIAENAFREGTQFSRWGSTHYGTMGTLKSVVLPSTLREIAGFAFAGCKGLETLRLPQSLQTIGEKALLECIGLRQIALPEGLTSVGVEAFCGCEALQTIEFPASLGSLGRDALKDCPELTEIRVDAQNPTFASRDGLLLGKGGAALLWVPAGKKLKAFTVPPEISELGDRAFIDCTELEKIVIPANVKTVGSEVFPRATWSRPPALREIEAAPEAGSALVGAEVFDFSLADKPELVFPRLPVTFPAEAAVRTRLALGFCMHPEQYAEPYAAIYRDFAKSHEKTLRNRAKSDKLPAVEAYFAGGQTEKPAGYTPDLSAKKPSGKRKVEILEETVLKGTLEDLQAVLKAYKPFEMTARALGLAGRYRGAAFVRELMRAGATFHYKSDAGLQRKYMTDQRTAGGNYRTEYSLVLVPERLALKERCEYEYYYTPMYGVSHLDISAEQEEKALPLPERIEAVKALMEKTSVGLSLDEMLFWALGHGELEFADALMELGADLDTAKPTYYDRWGTVPTYLETITTGSLSVYWTRYVDDLSALGEAKVLPVLERLHVLAAAKGRRLALTQKLYDGVQWSDASLSFAMQNMDLSKINQKTALEAAVTKNAVGALRIMAEAGWLAQAKKRENLIAFAQRSGCHEALAWLLDYKNRTVDPIAEAEREEAKLRRELTEAPNSVSALKKNWSYKKLDDGTLEITSYKGGETVVEIPAMIGKARVTAVGEEAFYVPFWHQNRIKNTEARKSIISVTVPDGVTTIGVRAFRGCAALETVRLPESLRGIEKQAFAECEKLRSIELPHGVKTIGKDAFYGCSALADPAGFIVLSKILLSYLGTGGEVQIPAGVEVVAEEVFASRNDVTSAMIPSGVKTIGAGAFQRSMLASVRIEEGLETIGESAFEGTPLTSAALPESVKIIGTRAFAGCSRLRNISIPAGAKKLGKEILGNYDGGYYSSVPSGVYVRTPEGSAAAEYMRAHYSGVVVAPNEE